MKTGFLRACAAIAMALLCACSDLPTLGGRSVSVAIPPSAETGLGAAVQALRQGHDPGWSGIVPLAAGLDAFAARATLADAAQRSLDLQYYIWHDDVSGSLLFDALRRAADRGVRVRLLLDDNNTAGLDDVLRSLDGHPNIEVRLFNPFTHRRWRVLDYLTDFERLNRRMHNKSFTADNQATVIGGRNVGDEYFGAAAGMLFMDLDVLAIGPVVTQVSSDFDKYWASDSAYPADRLLPAGPADARSAPVPPGRESDAARAYGQAVARSTFMRDLLARRLRFEWAPTELVSDDPAKALGRAAPADYLWTRLRNIVPPAATELQLVSPYFVPTESGAAFFSGLARRGVRVSILTNSLEATDVPAVHSGYARWREPLLDAGVRLFELKRESAAPPVEHSLLGGSSSSSLHAKTFVMDRRLLFVGSFNFDPRSARLNTELAFVIHSPVLAGAMSDRLAERVQAQAYSVRLADGKLYWLEQRAEGERRYDQEPHAGFWRRASVAFLSLLPIEGLL